MRGGGEAAFISLAGGDEGGGAGDELGREDVEEDGDGEEAVDSASKSIRPFIKIKTRFYGLPNVNFGVLCNSERPIRLLERHEERIHFLSVERKYKDIFANVAVKTLACLSGPSRRQDLAGQRWPAPRHSHTLRGYAGID